MEKTFFSEGTVPDSQNTGKVLHSGAPGRLEILRKQGSDNYYVGLKHGPKTGVIVPSKFAAVLVGARLLNEQALPENSQEIPQTEAGSFLEIQPEIPEALALAKLRAL